MYKDEGLRIISKKILREFWVKHSDCEQQLNEVAKASWLNFNELKNDYPNASILQNNRICFNIKGNNYRLIVRVNFGHQILWIRFIGIHSEYDKTDANNLSSINSIGL